IPVSVNLHHNALAEHLASWGLRRFDSDSAYFQWQRDVIPDADLVRLTELAQHKSAHHGDVAAEVAFYDFSVRPGVLPALYSQRYDYYMAIGPLVAARIGAARAVLDFGCGPGILTTFYARQFPNVAFLGIDRSAVSVSVAQERAEQLGLKNIRFERGDADLVAPLGSYDLIIATHALLQSEHDPGVPSADWRTFERLRDACQQGEFERRSGLGSRLDHLSSVLASDGRLLVFEKTRQLARRIPFQRAFAARRWILLETPLPIRYTVVEEVADDGPFYVLGRISTDSQRAYAGHEWDESPELDHDAAIDIAQFSHSAAKKDEPLYENHSASAQRVWAQLSGRQIVHETTRVGPDGRQVHVERGQVQGLSYLFCANTFDQRQLVLVKPEQAGMLEEYYQEIVHSIDERLAG
ncbi:MAG TPA: methyltransferase domain-containing protein, partial [Nitrospiraceae bacterium]|nr:methyltransferase domain-containing protein [Nitrospiraceae bacterium]